MRFFLSSTYEDLKGFRQVAINTLEDLCCEVDAMEYFEASTRTNKEICLSKLKKADLVIGIYGRRYGSVDRETGISFTELEYDEAVSNNIPILGFVLECEPFEREDREKVFIKKIYDTGKLCAKISKKKDFVVKLSNSLSSYFDGLEGYDYTGIWSDITMAQNQISSKLNIPIPGENDIDNVLSQLDQYGKTLDISTPDKVSQFKLIVAYLKLYRLRERLLHEVWSEELREEILKARDSYIKLINVGSRIID